MKTSELSGINKLYFGYEDIARALGISRASARVSATRYAKQGYLVRVKRNLYVLRERWKAMGPEERFALANIVQVPSYVSLMSALDHYGITTQVQRGFVESVALKRTKEITVDGAIFRYTKIDERLYFGFRREQGFFIATPEKAFLDALYLMSMGRYSIDAASLDMNKLDKKALSRMAGKFPQRTRRMLKEHG
jgi:predicted transcriptional regulator of viral defense system